MQFSMITLVAAMMAVAAASPVENAALTTYEDTVSQSPDASSPSTDASGCTITPYTNKGCTGSHGSTVSVGIRDVCVNTLGRQSFDVSHNCRGLKIVAFKGTGCGTLEPNVFTDPGCHTFASSPHPQSIRANNTQV